MTCVFRPPNWIPPPRPPLPTRCGKPPGCRDGHGLIPHPVGSEGNRGPCAATQASNASNPTWLFNLDEDPTEQCDLAAAEPQILAQVLVRLDAYTRSEVPVVFPEGDAQFDPGHCQDPPLDYYFAKGEAAAAHCFSNSTPTP